MTLRSRLVLPLAIVGLAGLLGSCTSDDAATDSPTTEAPATADAPATTGAPADDTATAGRGDWTDERYDFGTISSVERVDGHVEIVFDRQQLYSEQGDLQSGSQFTEEPILTGNTDAPMVNENDQLRRYVVAPEADLLRVHLPQPCADGTNEDVEVTWDIISEDDLVAGATEVSTPESVDTFTQVALTFDATGLVTRVRLGAGC